MNTANSLIIGVEHASIPTTTHLQPLDSFAGTDPAFQPLPFTPTAMEIVSNSKPQGSLVANEDDDDEMDDSGSTMAQSVSDQSESGTATDDDAPSVQCDDENHGMSVPPTTPSKIQAPSEATMARTRAGMDQKDAPFVTGMTFGPAEYGQFSPTFLQSNGSQMAMNGNPYLGANLLIARRRFSPAKNAQYLEEHSVARNVQSAANMDQNRKRKRDSDSTSISPLERSMKKRKTAGVTVVSADQQTNDTMSAAPGPSDSSPFDGRQ